MGETIADLNQQRSNCKARPVCIRVTRVNGFSAKHCVDVAEALGALDRLKNFPNLTPVPMELSDDSTALLPRRSNSWSQALRRSIVSEEEEEEEVSESFLARMSSAFFECPQGH